MSTQEHFLEFYEKIKLTPLQREDAKTKYKGVCKKLHDHYYEGIEFNGNTKLLIGSYGKKTNIRPPRDVDVLFIMPPDKFKQYADNESNGQSQLLQDIKKILSEKYTTTDKIKGWGKVVLVQFSDGTHNVELLPAWENEDGSFKIPNSENGGRWETWDPRKEIKKIKDSDSKTGKTKALIRMIKKWSECSVNLKSFNIENKVIAFFQNGDSYEEEYSTLVRNFFQYFKKTNTAENLKGPLNTAFARAEKARDYEKESKIDKAVEEWRKIFGDPFPVNIKKDISTVETIEDKLKKFQEAYPSPEEEFLERDYGIRFAINSAYQIRIDATVTQDGFRPRLLSSFIQNNFPLLKRKKLIFSIVKNNIPVPHSIMWKVRNFGEEAKKAEDLRGEITHDKGRRKKEENTKYHGDHYVECYIIINNLCVATDKILVPIGVC